jgi:hypothetical protein
MFEDNLFPIYDNDNNSLFNHEEIEEISINEPSEHNYEINCPKFSFNKTGEVNTYCERDDESRRDTKVTSRNSLTTVSSEPKRSICDISELFPSNFKTMIEPKFLIHRNSSRRKLQGDAIRKKIMSNFLNNSTLNKLNQIIENEYCSDNFKLIKLKQEIVTKIDTKTIKEIIHKPLLQIFLSDGNSFNRKIIIRMMKINDIFLKIMSTTFYDAYELYYVSRAYKNDLKRIKMKESVEYVQKYEQFSKKFTNFYINSTKKGVK